MGLLFEWDAEKAASNLLKHGVSFDEARTVLGDPHEMTIFDEDHSEDEDRYISMGLSGQGRVVVVSYTERDDRIRIISARVANKRERAQYEKTK
jgi:uncharacterized DUF497 family protein